MNNSAWKIIFAIFFLIFSLILISACEDWQIDINIAEKEELENLQGVGPVIAQRIIDFRSEEKFRSVDDLVKVNGIGESRLADIKEQGLACVRESDGESGGTQENQTKGTTGSSDSGETLVIDPAEGSEKIISSGSSESKVTSKEPVALDPITLNQNPALCIK